MKTILTTLLLSSYALHAANEADDYLNFVIQIQNDANQTTHKIDDVTPVGRSTALQDVTTSSIFQLWTINRKTAQEYLLDEKTVSSYHPEAEITITSDDPYTAIPRTRVDHPFQVTYSVSGLVTNDPDVQEAAKAAVLEHTTTSYAEDGATTKYPQQEIRINGSTTKSMLTLIGAEDLTTARGEEMFTIYAKPDFGKEEASMLARAKVQIWPIAQASITGIDTEAKYVRLPSITLNLVDLYPSSTTYVRIYEGAPNSNPQNAISINTSYVIIEDTEPQNRRFLLSGLHAFVYKPGGHTVEIIHETPFGSDILAQVYPLTMKTKLKVVGSLNSSE